MIQTIDGRGKTIGDILKALIALLSWRLIRKGNRPFHHNDVLKEGDVALLKYTRLFDKVDFENPET